LAALNIVGVMAEASNLIIDCAIYAAVYRSNPFSADTVVRNTATLRICTILLVCAVKLTVSIGSLCGHRGEGGGGQVCGGTAAGYILSVVTETSFLIEHSTLGAGVEVSFPMEAFTVGVFTAALGIETIGHVGTIH